MVDFGYPQKTDVGILKTFITQQGIKSTVRYDTDELAITIRSHIYALYYSGYDINFLH